MSDAEWADWLWIMSPWQNAIYDLLMQIRHLQVTPLEWGCSWTHPVPKMNGQTGCEAARLINILDAFGKA
eukprot:12532385-Heterocapsa_arctica.AAC.1